MAASVKARDDNARLTRKAGHMDGEGNEARGADGAQGEQQQAQGAEAGAAQEMTYGKHAVAGGEGAGPGPGVDAAAYEAQIAERDGRIAELEAQVAEAAKSAEAADELRGQIAELKQQGEDERVEFALLLAGCRNVKAARAVLGDHGGDVEALKAAEPWMFADAPQKQTGKTGLPNAGTATDEGKQMRRWEKIAGLADED